MRYLPLVLLAISELAASDLSSRGYSVLPAPQQVTLTGPDLAFGPAYILEGNDAAAAASLREQLGAPSHSGTRIRLLIDRQRLEDPPAPTALEAYRLEIAPGRVTITAIASAGLFYGVQTLLQLLASGGNHLPQGEIVDWPDLPLRQIYWDDAHHLERPEALRHAIAQAAYYKINGFVIKLDGHFQYRSAPAVVEPYAISPAELQSLTDLALARHVQLIPYLDAPGHIAFILKHPEYAALREFPDSNFEGCATNPDFTRLITGMFADLLAANKGVTHFYLSTDEPYYVGLAHNSQCDETTRARELGSVGKLLAEFITTTANWLHERGREVYFWGERPMVPADIEALPRYLINAETYGPQYDPVFAKHGIRSMIFTSVQGMEQQFPQYSLLEPGERLHPATGPGERMNEVAGKIASDPARATAQVIGADTAGWADSGLHPETFWLGYAAGTAAAWNARGDQKQSERDFYRLFYGPHAVNMERVYRLMSRQARFWEDSWETGPSESRKGLFGDSDNIFNPRRPSHDQFLPLPLTAGNSARRTELAAAFTRESDELLALLKDNVQRVDSNRYNLEVFLSIAHLCRHNLDMLTGLDRMFKLLDRGDLASLDEALTIARSIRQDRDAVLHEITTTWERSWYPRVEEANGRRFQHELDDVKDHWADRTVDLSYQMQREFLLPFGRLGEQIRTARNRLAAAQNLPADTQVFRW
ncbi:MAG TPA: beta-N-acetylhexosaminidase [Candidatus Sulfopaludibacter sp.]|jgi:hypothetical protein|nr:beta-N-acetylhexosaminidase [Candidatus Sulfopaludibacter sp.]